MTVWEEKTEVGGVTAGCYEGQGCARCCDKRSYARVDDAQSRMPCSGGRKKGRPRVEVRRVESRPAMRGRAARWWSWGVVRGMRREAARERRRQARRAKSMRESMVGPAAWKRPEWPPARRARVARARSSL